MDLQFLFGLVAGFVLGVIGGIITSIFTHWYTNTYDKVKRNIGALDHIELLLDFNLNRINLNLSLVRKINDLMSRREVPHISFEPMLVPDISTLVGLANLNLKYDLDTLCSDYSRHNFVISEYSTHYPEFRRMLAENKITKPITEKAINSNKLNIKYLEIILTRLKADSLKLMAQLRVIRDRAKVESWISKRAIKTDEDPPDFESKWQKELKQLQARKYELSKPSNSEP